MFRQIPFSVSSVMPHGDTVVIKKPKSSSVAVKIAVASGALLCAIAVAALVFSAKPHAIDDSEKMRVAEVKTLEIYEGQKIVRANLVLAEGSAPAIVKVVFHDEKGRDTLGPVFDVKRSSTKAINLPKKAEKVSVLVIRAEGEDKPRIVSFEPGVSVE